MDEAALGVLKDKRTQYTFSSHHSLVLSQIEAEYPGNYYLFPCHLGWRSGVDKDVMELVFQCSGKGMGPSAVQGAIENLKWHYWQRREALWAQYLILRMRHQLPTERRIDAEFVRRNVQRFPDYTSEGICGRVPSEGLLVDMHCKIMTEKRPEMDSQMV